LNVFQKFKVFPDGDLRDFSMLGEIFRGKRAVHDTERIGCRAFSKERSGGKGSPSEGIDKKHA
jgi:hypothetical protein